MSAPFTRTKIVVTLGPATHSAERIASLVEAGADVFRINMSHADADEARQLAARIRATSDKVAVLIDTQGPELRTTDVDQPFMLERGRIIRLRSGRERSTADIITVSHPDLPSRLSRGAVVFVDDGLIQLRVRDATDTEAECVVERGGEVRSRRGVNVPGVDVSPPELIPADRLAAELAAEVEAEFIAASFVQSADDVHRIRRAHEEAGGRAHIIAKVESRRAVDDAEAILDAADGIMVARGDLGVEIPPEEVPLVQKRLVRMCNAAAKPVIVATQMLESMIDAPVATRAETSDVANAIIDGADAVMLSGETARGRYPVESVQTMFRISDFVERNTDLFQRGIWHEVAGNTADVIAKAACRAAEDLDLDYIVALTTAGATARRIARYRPSAIVLTTTADPFVARQLALVHGVIPFVVRHGGHFAGAVSRSLSALVDHGPLALDSRVVVVFGVPMEESGVTNFLACDSALALIEGTA